MTNGYYFFVFIYLKRFLAGILSFLAVAWAAKELAKRQVRGFQESPKMVRCCLSKRLDMFDSAINSLTRVESNAPYRL